MVSSPDEITRERLKREATLLDSVERETECEAVTERETECEAVTERETECEAVTERETECEAVTVPYKDAPTSIPLRRYLNCLEQDDPELTQAMSSHYIRQITNCF